MIWNRTSLHELCNTIEWNIWMSHTWNSNCNCHCILNGCESLEISINHRSNLARFSEEISTKCIGSNVIKKQKTKILLQKFTEETFLFVFSSTEHIYVLDWSVNRKTTLALSLNRYIDFNDPMKLITKLIKCLEWNVRFKVILFRFQATMREKRNKTFNVNTVFTRGAL